MSFAVVPPLRDAEHIIKDEILHPLSQVLGYKTTINEMLRK